MIRIISALFALLFLASSCGDQVIKKPANLIDEEKMTDIIYDLSILEAAKSQKQAVLDSNGINTKTYIFKKYKIDSLQFAKSNQYYATDLDNYKKMYDNVLKRIDGNKKKTDSLVKIKGGTVPKDNPDTPQVK